MASKEKERFLNVSSDTFESHLQTERAVQLLKSSLEVRLDVRG